MLVYVQCHSTLKYKLFNWLYFSHWCQSYIIYCSTSLKYINGFLQNPIRDDVIKWKHFPRYWPFVRENHRWPLNSPHKGRWHGALMLSLICTWINAWVNNREAGDLIHHSADYDVIVMLPNIIPSTMSINLTHWGLVTSFGGIVMGQHWLR